METKRILKFAAAGLAVLSAVTLAHAQSRVLPHPTPPARSYLCMEGGSAAEVTRKANKAGERGWKLITASHGVWCFEQLSAVRPQERQ